MHYVRYVSLDVPGSWHTISPRRLWISCLKHGLFWGYHVLKPKLVTANCHVLANTLDACCLRSDGTVRYFASGAKVKVAQGVSGAVVDKGSLRKYLPYLIKGIRHGIQVSVRATRHWFYSGDGCPGSQADCLTSAVLLMSDVSTGYHSVLKWKYQFDYSKYYYSIQTFLTLGLGHTWYAIMAVILAFLLGLADKSFRGFNSRSLHCI